MSKGGTQQRGGGGGEEVSFVKSLCVRSQYNGESFQEKGANKLAGYVG